MARRHLDSRKCWDRHEQLYVDIFLDALSRLAETSEVAEKQDETEISKALYLRLRDVCHKRYDGILPPMLELPIPPDSDEDIQKHAKRPDFTCPCVDTSAGDQASYEILFHVECKRLGERRLNRLYVEKGVKRFDCRDHQYGKRASSGMMIGYIVKSKTFDALSDVNEFLQKALMPELTFDDWNGRVCHSNQQMKRQDVAPKEFKLIHCWANLRRVVAIEDALLANA